MNAPMVPPSTPPPPPTLAPPLRPQHPEVSPDLVRARLALGWDATEAVSRPPVPKARLSPEEVGEVRASTATARQLSQRHGISVRHVRRIRSRRAWKGV